MYGVGLFFDAIKSIPDITNAINVLSDTTNKIFFAKHSNNDLTDKLENSIYGMLNHKKFAHKYDFSKLLFENENYKNSLISNNNMIINTYDKEIISFKQSCSIQGKKGVINMILKENNNKNCSDKTPDYNIEITFIPNKTKTIQFTKLYISNDKVPKELEYFRKLLSYTAKMNKDNFTYFTSIIKSNNNEIFNSIFDAAKYIIVNMINNSDGNLKEEIILQLKWLIQKIDHNFEAIKKNN